MARSEIEINTDDGVCRASIFRPSGKGPWPGVLMFMDGIGYRPALFEIADKIAEHGYLVLLPDVFYRVGPYTAPEPKKLFTDETVRNEWFKTMRTATDQDKTKLDTRAFIDYLVAQPDITSPLIGTTGYCMGAGMSLSAAGFYPEHVAACAGFHPGRIATDEPTSPHLLAPNMKARVYIAGAIEDANFPDDMKQRLDDALTEAHLAHTVETYPARHGWVPSDTPVHDPVQAERHFTALFSLFDQTLKA
jgi:carboxymethylenebutenolidase